MARVLIETLEDLINCRRGVREVEEVFMSKGVNDWSLLRYVTSCNTKTGAWSSRMIYFMGNVNSLKRAKFLISCFSRLAVLCELLGGPTLVLG